MRKKHLRFEQLEVFRPSQCGYTFFGERTVVALRKVFGV